MTNADFATGDLTGWTTFTTVDGTNGPGYPIVTSFDTDGDGVNSTAATFNVGRTSGPTPGPLAGGGIFQTFNSAAGFAVFSADIAAFYIDNTGLPNASAGVFSLLVDGNVLDSVDLGVIQSSTILRDSLSGSALLAAGSHELRLEVRRPYGPTGTGDPLFQYIDDVSGSIRETDSTVPEPATLTLLTTGMVGLGARYRRRRR